MRLTYLDLANLIDVPLPKDNVDDRGWAADVAGLSQALCSYVIIFYQPLLYWIKRWLGEIRGKSCLDPVMTQSFAVQTPSR